MVWIAELLAQRWSYFVDIDRIIAEEHALLLVDGDHQSLFSNFFHRAGARHIEFDSRLKNWCGHHENDEQHEHDIHQGSDVDVGNGSLGASIRGGECHQRRTSAGTGWRSTAFNISRAKSSLRAAKSRIELPIKL